MAADLPAELLAHVLKLAQEGDAPPEQLQTRLAFERVCKAWFNCDHRWRLVAVDGAVNIQKLVDTLIEMKRPNMGLRKSRTSAEAGGGRAPVADVALTVKTLHIRLNGPTAQPVRGPLVTLLSLVTAVESLEISTEEVGLAGRGHHALGESIIGALAELAKIQHFTFGGWKDHRIVHVCNGVLRR